MNYYSTLSDIEKNNEYESLISRYKDYVNMGLSLDLSRGKPNSEQLDFAQDMLAMPITEEDYISATGVDYRNYGILDGIPEAKKLFSDLLSINPDNIIVGGNSSLQLMYDTLVRFMLFGTPDSQMPWSKEDKIKWICVCPGYDRHFKITEDLGFELISVKMLADGPDMDAVEALVSDPAVKGIWCVPKYSNPTGNTYSEATMRRLLSMKCAAQDFKIMWDNAYCVHDFDNNGDVLPNVFDIAEECGASDRVMYFSSTSKITFPGSGIAMMAASKKNLDFTKKCMSTQTIGYDKINQLRHVKYFKTADNIIKHMLKLGAKIKEKFDITLGALEELRALDIAEWTVPHGGYFVSLDMVSGKAGRVYQLMSDAGVTLTKVGATFPYGIDPEDKNLRLAPTYPNDSDLAMACKVLVLAVKLAALEHEMNK